MQSEVDLDDEVKKLLVMAGSPELYPVLVVSLAWLLLAAEALVNMPDAVCKRCWLPRASRAHA